MTGSLVAYWREYRAAPPMTLGQALKAGFGAPHLQPMIFFLAFQTAAGYGLVWAWPRLVRCAETPRSILGDLALLVVLQIVSPLAAAAWHFGFARSRLAHVRLRAAADIQLALLFFVFAAVYVSAFEQVRALFANPRAELALKLSWDACRPF